MTLHFIHRFLHKLLAFLQEPAGKNPFLTGPIIMANRVKIINPCRLSHPIPCDPGWLPGRFTESLCHNLILPPFKSIPQLLEVIPLRFGLVPPLLELLQLSLGLLPVLLELPPPSFNLITPRIDLISPGVPLKMDKKYGNFKSPLIFIVFFCTMNPS